MPRRPGNARYFFYYGLKVHTLAHIITEYYSFTKKKKQRQKFLHASKKKKKRNGCARVGFRRKSTRPKTIAWDENVFGPVSTVVKRAFGVCRTSCRRYCLRCRENRRVRQNIPFAGEKLSTLASTMFYNVVFYCHSTNQLFARAINHRPFRIVCHKTSRFCV